MRQAFGWRLAQTSSRSFATGGSMLGIGTDMGGGIVVGGGQVAMQNAHFTDLILERAPSHRSRHLGQLEAQYDAVSFQPPASHWSTVIVAALVFGVGLFGGIAVFAALGSDTSQSVSPGMFLVPLAIGIALGVMVTRWRQKRRDAYNAAAELQQRQLLETAQKLR